MQIGGHRLTSRQMRYRGANWESECLPADCQRQAFRLAGQGRYAPEDSFPNAPFSSPDDRAIWLIMFIVKFVQLVNAVRSSRLEIIYIKQLQAIGLERIQSRHYKVILQQHMSTTNHTTYYAQYSHECVSTMAHHICLYSHA